MEEFTTSRSWLSSRRSNLSFPRKNFSVREVLSVMWNTRDDTYRQSHTQEIWQKKKCSRKTACTLWCLNSNTNNRKQKTQKWNTGSGPTPNKQTLREVSHRKTRRAIERWNKDFYHLTRIGISGNHKKAVCTVSDCFKFFIRTVVFLWERERIQKDQPDWQWRSYKTEPKEKLSFWLGTRSSLVVIRKQFSASFSKKSSVRNMSFELHHAWTWLAWWRRSF